MPKNLIARVPEEVDLADAAYATVGAIALHGVRRSAVNLGEWIGVVGLGLVGQLAVRIAAAGGCGVIGIDLDPAAVELARNPGALAFERSDATLEAAARHAQGSASTRSSFAPRLCPTIPSSSRRVSRATRKWRPRRRDLTPSIPGPQKARGGLEVARARGGSPSAPERAAQSLEAGIRVSLAWRLVHPSCHRGVSEAVTSDRVEAAGFVDPGRAQVAAAATLSTGRSALAARAASWARLRSPTVARPFRRRFAQRGEVMRVGAKREVQLAGATHPEMTTASRKTVRRSRNERLAQVYALYHLHFARARMAEFMAAFDISAETRILDVGGTALNWSLVACPAEITLLNLEPPGQVALPPRARYVQGDARGLPWPTDSFDIVFSNSVIEHLYTLSDQRAFARETRRVGRGLWIQTPAKCFPVEPHFLMPYIQYLPRAWQPWCVRNLSVWGWIMRPTEVEAEKAAAEIRLLTKREMTQLFPDCRLRVEKLVGLTKSYIAVRSP